MIFQATHGKTVRYFKTKTAAKKWIKSKSNMEYRKRTQGKGFGTKIGYKAASLFSRLPGV
ncbi:MAG: hypothetical protein WD876_02190 [Candidatus Pacearchaeota archaeon]